MAGQVLPLFANYFSYPFFYFRVVYVIIVDPVFITSIIGRVYVNKFDPAFILGQESFEGQEVVAVDYEVF
jgi:hypothetical protein